MALKHRKTVGLKSHYDMGPDEIVIEIEDDGSEINIHKAGQSDEESIGQFEFCETDDGNLYLTWMGIEENYKRCGLGREGLRLLKAHAGLKIFAADDDGRVRDDGSHLTNDALFFVEKMRRESLIENSHDAGDDH